MGTSRGTLRQDFIIRMGVGKLIDYITEQVTKTIDDGKTFREVDIDESYIEDGEFVITGTYTTDYEHWWCRGTLESPPEDEVERACLDDGDNTWLLDNLPKEIRDCISITSIEEELDRTRMSEYELDY